jgi:hypothetical protein
MPVVLGDQGGIWSSTIGDLGSGEFFARLGMRAFSQPQTGQSKPLQLKATPFLPIICHKQ